MQDDERFMEEGQWIIWNGSLGIRDFVTIDRIEVESGGRCAWLEAPYDMVGPFSFDALEVSGEISFAACVVMSRQKWQENQRRLREEAYKKRLEAQERLFEELLRNNKRKRLHTQHYHEKMHRELLELPVEGVLESSQIKAAYRRLAKRSHPDVGGTHELFVQITDARDALLEGVL